MFIKKKENELFEIKSIKLSDCLEDRNFLPFSLIEKKSTNAYENMMSEMNENNPFNSTYIEYRDKYIRRYVYLNSEPIQSELLDAFSEEMRQILFGLIIKKSFKFFSKLIKITKETAINIHLLAKEYGKLPIQILAEKNEYNYLDAYIFNTYCLYCGKELEKKQIEAALRKNK